MTSLVVALLAHLTTAAAVQIVWASEPAFPGETVVLHGGPFSSTCNLTVAPSPLNGAEPVTVAAAPGQASESSIKFTLPASLPVGGLSLVVQCEGEEASPPLLLNAASPWWFQGDGGTFATQGGWVRVFGPTLALQPPQAQEAQLLAGIRRVRDSMAAPSSPVDAAWEDASPLAALAAQLLALRQQLNATRAAQAAPITLRLTPATGPAVYLPAQRDSAAPHSAAFPLPPSLPAGSYSLAVANGQGQDSDAAAPPGAGAFASAAFFESAAAPSKGSITVQPPSAWPPGLYTVDTPSDPCSPMPCPTSDASLQRALAAAAAGGGGTVLFPRGAYFLTQPVSLPPNTLLAGSATEEVALWFQEWNLTTAPKAPLFSLNDTLAAASAAPPAVGDHAATGVASWGLARLTLFLTAFHNEVIVVSNRSNGFVLQGLRVRDNPFAFTWGTGPGSASRGRVANWTAAQVGQMVDIHGTNNRISGCDLWGVNQLLNSFAPDGSGGKNNWPGWRRGHQYSWISDNVLWNGQSSHFMQLWRQVIFERNAIVGATEAAGGQSVGTGPMGGVAQHIYHADNVVRFTWGGDREVMTFDDAGGAYYGALAALNGTEATLLHDAWPASDWEMGGWYGGQMLVINGTGAHQIRRIVTPGVNTTPALSNRSWGLSAPFAIAPALGPGGSFVQVMPFRGRNIFFRDRYIETGPHQFYGHGVQNLVSQCRFEGVRGLMAWGQWRGWTPPPPMNSSSWEGWGGSQEPSPLQGLMGNGYQPNLQNVYRGNAFSERHHLTNYACGEAGYTEQWGWKNVVAYPANVVGNITSTPHPLNVGIVHRDAQLVGGVWLGNDTADWLVEGGSVSWGGEQCIVQGSMSQLVMLSRVQCTP